MNSSPRFVWLIALAGFVGLAFSTQACEFCNGLREKPLVLQFEDTHVVLMGHFENAKRSNDGLEQGTSDLVVERIFKDNPMVKQQARIVEGKTLLTVPHYVPDPKKKFIVFAEVYKGKIDYNHAKPLVNDSEMLKYIEGILKLKEKPQAERLRFAFDFLNSPESEVSMDAYREFSRADYSDYKEMAKKLPPDTIAGWLKDPKTPTYRYGLYASLLGHCGKAEHAKLLMSMIEATYTDKSRSSGTHGLMAGYLMLEPQKGWAFLKDLVKQDPDERAFLVRYTGLQTMRFVYETRPDLVNNKDAVAARTEIVQGVLGAMTQMDMSDFAIEDLRKWRRWECCEQVLGMFGHKPYNTSVIRKSILRYALQCPMDSAQKFVKTQRAINAEWVDDTKELLELESPPSTVTPTSK